MAIVIEFLESNVIIFLLLEHCASPFAVSLFDHSRGLTLSALLCFLISQFHIYFRI